MCFTSILAQECGKCVSSETGKGLDATLEEPAKDLGKISSNLEAGDVICIAGGTRLGRGDSRKVFLSYTQFVTILSGA